VGYYHIPPIPYRIVRVLTFHLAWRAASGPLVPHLRAEGDPLPALPGALTVPTRLVVLPGLDAAAVLTLEADPATLTLTATAAPAALHYFRLADGTVEPLPPSPVALAFSAGDAYLAVAWAAGPPSDLSTALARFLHLRDYFNADKLAAAVLDHLAELSDSASTEGAGVLVIELR
jgi:hypothetical protein